MNNWPPNNNDDDMRFDNNTGMGRESHNGGYPDDIGDIIRNINQKASNKRFEMTIADEEFYQIPDVEYKSPRYKEVEKNIEREQIAKDKKNHTAELPDLKNKNNNPPAPTPKEKKIKRTGVFGGIVYTLCVIAVSIVLSIVLMQSAQDFLGLFKEKSPITITISEGDSVNDVANELERLGVIKQPFTFSVYTKYKEKIDKIEPGKFEINKNMSYGELISKLQKKEEKGIVTITLIEGKTIFDLGELLEENKVCTADAFFKALDERAENPVYEWEKDIPDDPDRFSKYEGYFYPNTHQMFIGEDPNSVVKKFLDNFNLMFNDDIRERAFDIDMTIDEVVILASMLEKEASGSIEHLDKVSAVFHNRLDNPGVYPMLQSDVTREYVNNFIEGRVSETDRQRYAAAYNTYKMDGLPAGPVCNPGGDAISSVLYPDEDFDGVFYFVTDINHQFYYSKTNDEHNYNVSLAKAATNDDDESGIGGLAIGDGEDDDSSSGDE